MGAVPEDVLDHYQEVLAKFMVRARRIENHSLLADLDQFVAWVSGKGSLTVGQGQASMRVDLPEEERFESLAARVRPLLLDEERHLHHKKVLAALGAFVREDDELMAARDLLIKEWKRATGSETLGFLAGRAPEDGSVGDLAPDVDLAHAWLYGDLVHASPDVPERTLQANLDLRYFAAVLVYGRAVFATIATLNVLRRAVERGLVELPGWAESEPVAVMTPFEIQATSMRMTPIEQPAGESEIV